MESGSGSAIFVDNISNASNGTEGACYSYSLLHIAAREAIEVGEKLINDNYSDENISLAVNGSNDSSAFYLPKIIFNTSDKRSENLHTFDSAALLLIMFLLFLTVITIWVFKVKRFRVLHETGLSMIYGIAIGVVLRYAISPQGQPEYYLATRDDNCSERTEFVTGESIELISFTGDDGTEERFLCSVVGRVFANSQGNYIQQTLLFDPEIFFFGILPPIIFYAGFSLQKRHFFRNLGSLLLYAFAGTTVSCFIVGGLMYGYSLSGAESTGSAFANLTGYPIPPAFRASIIPSLLFGSLISATDPVTVLAIFHDLKVDHDLYSLVFGESVMNDAVAIVLFRSIDEYSTGEGSSHFEVLALFRSIGTFIGIFLGSFLLGCAMGLLTALLMKFSKLREYPLLETSMFVIMSYSTYLLAEFAQLTGIVAVLFCGIMQSYYTFFNLSVETRKRTKDLFELLNFLAENFVFSYMGLSLFTYTNHQWVPGFILFSFAVSHSSFFFSFSSLSSKVKYAVRKVELERPGNEAGMVICANSVANPEKLTHFRTWVAIFAGRVINIYILSFILNLGRAKKINFRFQHMLVFAGLRGAIAFALAIRNTQTEQRQLIFTTTLCIVMVTVLFCGGLTTLALQCLRIRVGVEDDPGFTEEVEMIPYDPRKGNWFVSRWTKLNTLYLLPIFTHSGRAINTFCPDWCVPVCTKCKPSHDKLEESEISESELSEEEEEEEDKVISFRRPQGEEEEEEEVEEGDLGLGADSHGSHYMPLGTSEDTVESTL